MLNWNIQAIQLELNIPGRFQEMLLMRRPISSYLFQMVIIQGKGEAAPNIRYHETAEETIKEFKAIKSSLDRNINDVSELIHLIEDAPINNALRFAIESAWFRFQQSRDKKSFYNLTGIYPPEKIAISYTIPIMETGLLKDFFAKNDLGRFSYIKLKVNHENAFESLKHLLSLCKSPVMVDANESFTDVDDCIRWFEMIRSFPLVLIEQPMPSHMKDESVYLKKYSPFELFADESITDQADFSMLNKAFDGINMKLMKAGGYLNGIRLLKEARRYKLKTMIGCMVETTLGISSAMQLCSLVDYADLDSFLLVKNEPFGLVEEHHGILTFV
jgi:L-alanine-DL-glutamate epimerase-like enolase superfamily enzyme